MGSCTVGVTTVPGPHHNGGGPVRSLHPSPTLTGVPGLVVPDALVVLVPPSRASEDG
jgi:hypothetical protein